MPHSSIAPVRLRRLRRAVLAANLLGQVAAALAEVLPWAWLPATLALMVLGTRAAATADAARARWLLVISTGTSVVMALFALPRLVGVDDPDQLRSVLGLLLVNLSVCQGLAWRSVRDVRSGLFSALGLLVLAASYAPDLLVGLPLLLGWLAVLVALVELQGVRQLEGVKVVVSGPTPWGALAVPTALAVVLGLVAFLLVPAPVASSLRNRLSAAGSLPPGDRGAEGAFSGQRLDLRARGSLGTQPVARVPADSPELWRSTTFDRYDGTAWSRAARASQRLSGPPYIAAESDGPSRTDQVQLLRDADGTVWSPGALLTLEAPTGTRVFSSAVGDVEASPLSSYRVTSLLPITDAEVLQTTSGVDDGEDRWRLVPSALPARVDALAHEITAGARTRFEAATLIEQWLETHLTYRLDSPVPRRGEDAVDRFLFVDRTGFCEQFATAQAVLLRTLGIPARLVTGLAYGRPDGGARLYRGDNLHAWVEYWVLGVGWVTSDPTAGVPLAEAGGQGARSKVVAAVNGALQDLQRVPGGRPTLAVALLALTAVVALVLLRRPRRRRTTDTPAPVPVSPGLAAFLRFDARLGERRRRRGESLRELSGRLQPAPELGSALTVVEQELYAPVVPSGVDEAIAVLDRSQA